MTHRRRRVGCFSFCWLAFLGALGGLAASAGAADAAVAAAGPVATEPGLGRPWLPEGPQGDAGLDRALRDQGGLFVVDLGAVLQALLGPAGDGGEASAGPLLRSEGAASGATPLPAPPAVLLAAGAALATTAMLVARPGWFLGLLMPLFSRIDRRDLLDHPVRRELMGLVARDPGMNTTDLHRRAGRGWGSLLYHLQRLEGVGLVVSHRWGRSRRYFPNGAGMAARSEGIRALKAVAAYDLATGISARPGQTQEELARELGLAKSVVSKYAKRLEHAGLVRRELGRNCLRLFPTPGLHELLQTCFVPVPAAPRPSRGLPVAGAGEEDPGQAATATGRPGRGPRASPRAHPLPPLRLPPAG